MEKFLSYSFFLIFFLFLFSISLASASFGYDSSATENLGTFKQGDCIQLIQVCSNCSYNNISKVLYPDSSIALENSAMQKDDTYYNYTFCNTTQLRIYLVNGYGDLDEVKTIWNYNFKITPTGVEQNSVLNNAIFIILFLSSLIFLGLGVGIKLPSLGFIGSILFLLSGIYTMIYGFSDITNLYTRGVAISFIGLGFVFMFISSYEWLSWSEEL